MKELSSAEFNMFLAMTEFHELFVVYRREDNGPMKSFWKSYLEMVSLLPNFISATGAREGNWSLHLDSIRRMLPWYFTYDHSNYARYLPVYLVHWNVTAWHPPRSSVHAGEWRSGRPKNHKAWVYSAACWSDDRLDTEQKHQIKLRDRRFPSEKELMPFSDGPW